MSIEEYKTGTSVCEFCGQALIAGAECSCGGARDRRRIVELIAKANLLINETFGESSVDSGYKPIAYEDYQVLFPVAEALAYRKARSAVLILKDGTKAKLVSDGMTIKIERVETRKKSETAI